MILRGRSPRPHFSFSLSTMKLRQLTQNRDVSGSDALALLHAQKAGATVEGEVENRRDWNSNTFRLSNGQDARIIAGGGKWVNFLGPDGNWKPIDCTLKADDRGFVTYDAPFTFFAPRFSDGEAYFESNCRYDIFRREEIADAPFGMYLSAVGVARVQGEVFDIDNNGRSDAVIYRNAFPQWNADLIYYVKHGRAPRLEKLVRFNSKPAVTPFPEFRIRYTQNQTMKVEQAFTDLPMVTQKAIEKKLAKAEAEAKKNTRDSVKAGREQLLSAMESMRTVFTKTTITKRSLATRPDGSLSDMRGIGFKDFFIWDSAEVGGKPERKKQRIDVEITKSGNVWTLRKILPAGFFDTAVFPVFTDATSTFYPDPHVESTCCDGQAYYTDGTSWSSTREAATGTYADASGVTSRAYVNKDSAPWMRMWRGFILLDLSSLSGQEATTAATLYLWAVTNWNYVTTKIGICASSPASNTDITTADYDQVAHTRYATDVAVADITTGQYTAWTFNATGIAAISYSIVKLSVQTDFDIDNTEPDMSYANHIVGMEFDSAENASGTAHAPKLAVTYPTPPADPTNLVVAAANGSTTLALTWDDNASDENEYYVERSENGTTGWTEIGGAQPANTESYNDALGTNSTTRYYRVRCKNTTNGLYSGYTSVANATTASAAPTIGAVTAGNGTQVLTVNWTDNSSDETTFSIEASANGTTGWSEVATDTASPYAHNVAAYDTTRYYRVRALRSGDGIYSGYSSVSAAATTSPAAPSAVGVATSGGDITVTWTDNSSSETTFSIERKEGSGGTYAELATDTASPYVDTTANDDTDYYYRVRAYRSGDAVYSGYATEAHVVNSLADAPSALAGSMTVYSAPSSCKVQLTWQVNSLAHYQTKIERSPDGLSYSTIATVDTAIRTYENTGLTADSTYYYRVSSVGANGGLSPTTDPITVSTAYTGGGDAANLLLAFRKKIRSFP